jgi:predicted nuclease of predicted toxin-antitoxin system
VRILLDECLPKDLRNHLPGHTCQTVPEAGLAGEANGELLSLAESAGWQVLLTVDKGMPYQQNFAGRTISLVIIRAKSNRIFDLLPLVPTILTALPSLSPGEVIQIG